MRSHFDILCHSHLRWDFVYQRPHHLLARAARDRRVIFVEEPIFEEGARPRFSFRHTVEGVTIAVPVLSPGLTSEQIAQAQAQLLQDLVAHTELRHYVLWMYSPMGMALVQGLEPSAVVYDCMDELSQFAGASAEIPRREVELLRRADVVFTGGHSLYQAKRHLHANIHPFPSAVDFAHFARARTELPEPPDQAGLPHPRVGFFGVVDERLDRDLLAGLADRRPDIHLVMIGPVVKIDPASLPRRSNIHWLGRKEYAELPGYIRGWDVAMLPFARNQATRFISPTKTPEYLAAGKPVVSTSIRDVVNPYGTQGLVRIADTPDEFAEAIRAALLEDAGRRIAAADRLVERMSWDRTWGEMERLIGDCLERSGLDTTTPTAPRTRLARAARQTRMAL